MSHIFTTLRHPVEKLLEAEHFLSRLVVSDGIIFQFELNAFLSASRSVTFTLQSAMSKVPSLGLWYTDRQVEMKADRAMRFFLELRNISQKEGPVSFVGGSLPNGRWTYRFVGYPYAVPEELEGVDITSGCAEHLQKLARLLLKCADAFPFHTCPYLAFSEEGMASLGYSWDDVAAAVGLPPDYLYVSGVTAEQKFHYLRKEIEPLDRLALERIAREELLGQEGPIEFHKSSGRGLVDYMAENLGNGAAAPRDVFLASVLQRISDVERER